MISKRQFGLLLKRRDQAGPALHCLQTSAGIAADVVDDALAQVGQFTLLGLAEQVLDRIQFRGRDRQPLQHAVPIERLDIIAHEPTAVSRHQAHIWFGGRHRRERQQ